MISQEKQILKRIAKAFKKIQLLVDSMEKGIKALNDFEKELQNTH